MIVFGYFIMKRLDDFLANNHHLIDEEIAENSLFIAFDNPMILDSLILLDDTYRCLIISTKQNSIICEKAGCTIEPLDSSVIQTAVIWKKASNNAFANSFSDFLFSNQAVINAEYVK